MKLHENIELFRDAVVATSQTMGIAEIYVEKDYWVTLALFKIFKSEIGGQIVFKGGTALSKCNKLIDRFSEDIDIVLLKQEKETGNQLKNRLKQIAKIVETVLPETEIRGITNKKGMIRKTAHKYDKTFTGHSGQIRENVIIEATWLGSTEPYETGNVNSLIYEMIKITKQFEIAKDYVLEPFEVNVLSPKRTLCEKIMSLVRFSFTENPVIDLGNKIRHIYDIHKILGNSKLNKFFQSEEFEELFLKVANDDVISFKNNNDWLQNNPKTAIIFSNTEGIWNNIRTIYFTTFKELVYGELPNEKDILKTLKTVAKRLETIEWKIKK
ncbi:MAG: nucleotidyl transferase AbiEii/AbiGii toxin family protein [Bacteroidales bacterium]|nr:nucleotidyl transferase AbiEii/AbiGii toxin family protein [Bacteroidales bacterium]